MPGLDHGILNETNFDLSLGRIQSDVKTDFILAPHLSVIYAFAGNELKDLLSKDLESGTYQPHRPILMEIPKANGLTRPGAILTPKDRLTYQLLIDVIAPNAETWIDRDRVFSNVYIDIDPDFQMFKSGSEAWEKFQLRIKENCEDTRFSHAIKTDVSNYFERIKHHNLITLLRTSGCLPSAVNLLEEVLASWTERTSFGILQGMFPSDFIGNFYLSVIDSALEIQDIESSRYVDDIYLFFGSKEDATEGLIELIKIVRKEGLSLNDAKTSIKEVGELLHEETNLDSMFSEAREEILAAPFVFWDYGFPSLWSLDEEEEYDEEDVEFYAVLALFEEIDNVSEPIAQKIDKFCLPILSAAKDPSAVDRALEGLLNRPHLSQLYCAYLSSIGANEETITQRVEEIFQNSHLPYDTQLMSISAYLSRAQNISTKTTKTALSYLKDASRSSALRAIFPSLIAKHGTPAQRLNLRNHYAEEPSEFVHSSILFASQYFPSAEQRAFQKAWGNHSYTNALIVQALRNLKS